MKGRAAKTLIDTTWHYEIGFGVYQFHGDEGETQGFQYYVAPSGERKQHQGHDLHIGRVCHVQNNKYDYSKKDAEALVKGKKRPSTISETPSKRQKKDAKIKKEETPRKETKEDSAKTGVGIIRIEDSEPESEDPIAEENLDLKAQLVKAQEKIVVMASTIEQIHRSMDPLVTRLRTAARIMKTAAKDAYFSKPEEADGLKNFAKDNKEIVNSVLESLNEGVQNLNNRFPGMADRVSDHAVDGPTAKFVAWASKPSLEDPEDEYGVAVWTRGAQE